MNRNIESSNIYKKQVNNLESSSIEYDIDSGDNWIKLSTNHHDYLFYTSKQNRHRIFKVRIFKNDNIQNRLIGKKSLNITDKLWKDKDIIVHRDEKIITYRNTDLGNTSNINRIEHLTETLGHPFRRKVSYNMTTSSKDRLQYRKECIELSTYDRAGNRKRIIDNVFATRVYRLYLRLKGYTQTQIYNILRKEKYISGEKILDIMEYLYQVMSSYHPFFYKENGLPKYNKAWLQQIIYKIKLYGNLDTNIPFCKVNRQKNTDKNTIKPADVLEWRAKRQELLDKGELYEEIE